LVSRRGEKIERFEITRRRRENFKRHAQKAALKDEEEKRITARTPKRQALPTTGKDEAASKEERFKCLRRKEL